MGRRFIYDTEAKGLLNSDSIDYNASPYKLKDPEYMHCAGFVDADRDFEILFEPLQVTKHEHVEFIMEEADELIGHNIINYDNLLLKLHDGISFEIGCSKLQIPDTAIYKGKRKEIIITDTLVMSKTLNPDRPHHSIEYFGKLLGLEKIDWRAKAIELQLIAPDAPKGAEWLKYHPEMGVYMMRDCHVNKRVYTWLMKEWGEWDWTSAYELEKAVAEIITRQEHRGFWFDRDKAVELVKDLDIKMEELRVKVEPLIPEKKLTKSALDNLTPPAKQFKMNGQPNAHILNFAKRHGGEFVEVDGKWRGVLYDKEYVLPIPSEPLYTHAAATLNDTLHIKEWLVSLGWNPSGYKERDLTVDSKKKKISKEKFDIAVDKWVDQTFASNFKADRLDALDYSARINIDLLKHKLKSHDHTKRSLKVFTNPMLCKGQEKEIDPNLLLLSAQFPYAKELSDYLTYKHRRNSILGGGIDPDDDEDMQKGWLSADRLTEDYRIPTPADTCGCNTSRFKHRVVANIPRVTSLYGTEMRSLFGVKVDEGYYQLGYDFAALEARIEAHYCWKYDQTAEKDYCQSLIREKPNDVHTITAKKIAEVIQQAFNRTPAKSVKYCCTYGGQPKRVAKTVGCGPELGQMIYSAFWDAAAPLKSLADRLKKYWETTGGKKFILGLDGRKVPTRSASALINSLFQSAGVICAKRAMVLHDRKMKGEGLSVDFFSENWKEKKYAQQLIAYHDEAQLELDKSLIKWKLFNTKEEAEEFKKESPTWSEIGHTIKGYYLGYSRVGELASESVRESGEYYNLNVALSADYAIGRNWAECH